MFAQRDFVSCIEQQLVERGFGAKRKAEILDRFDGLTKNYRSQGYGDQIAQSMAMSRVFADIAKATVERAKRTAKTLEVQAENNTRIAAGGNVKASSWLMDGGSGKGAGLARAAISLIQNDPRFPGVSAEQIRDGKRRKYWAMMADGLDNYGKGAFGTQRGSAGLYDIVREIFNPGSTKNKSASSFAKSYSDLNRVMVDDRNKAGGSLNFLDRYLPQKQNYAKVAKVDRETWKADMERWLDWDRMMWPNGEPIKPDQHAKILDDVYDTFTTSGANKIDPASFSGYGSSVGNALDDHRFLLYKDGDAWIEMHEAYGDGNVFDVVSHHIESMAHRNALVEKFGPNPEMALENVKALVLKHASALVKAGDKTAKAQAEKVIKNRLEPMFETYMHANPMDANSPFAAGVVATSNILTAAKLGSIPFLAAPGDMAQTLAVRMVNNMPLIGGMDTYLKGITFDYARNQKLAARHGFVFDNAVGATYTTERFSPVATYGPQLSRTISDGMIRMSGLNRHTEIARWTAQQEMSGMLYDAFKTKYDDLPFKHVLARYEIDEAAWDAVRKNVKAWEPETGVETFRPLDINDTKLVDKDKLYNKFFALVNQEAQYMVPGATLEANITLANGLRPDTIGGAILHSFKMYKNFPITFVQMYGRMAMAQERTATRIGFLAAIIGGATIVGAMGTQLRELSKGRTALPMDTATFWGKAFLAGGGASIWGDFLFNGINEYGRGPADMMAGPLANVAMDITNLTFGDPFKYVALSDMDRASDFKSTTASRAVNFLRMNTPGTSLWWARLALDREVWDALDELADPNIYRKRNQRVRKQERTYGNTYWSEPGAGLTGKGPWLTGR